MIVPRHIQPISALIKGLEYLKFFADKPRIDDQGL